METIIDTYGGKRPIRHHATIGHDDVAWTNCNHRIIRYFDAKHLSWFYADGTRHAWPCRRCFSTEWKKLQNESEDAKEMSK